jgi:hypothetical protein
MQVECMNGIDRIQFSLKKLLEEKEIIARDCRKYRLYRFMVRSNPVLLKTKHYWALMAKFVRIARQYDFA